VVLNYDFAGPMTRRVYEHGPCFGGKRADGAFRDAVLLMIA